MRRGDDIGQGDELGRHLRQAPVALAEIDIEAGACEPALQDGLGGAAALETVMAPEDANV